MSNNIKVSIPLSGLFKRETYNYVYRGLGGNWPAIISPLSGSFEAKGKTETLNAMISFCPSTGLCPQSNPSVLAYSVQGCGYDNNYLYTNIAVDLTSSSDNLTTRSNSTIVSCSGSCLPEVDIKFSGLIASVSGLPSGLADHTLSRRGTYTYDFISSLSGLQPNSTYDYVINGLGGNWPAVMITPMSGSFRPHDETYKLDHKLMFCPATNLCPSSTRGYLTYTSGQCFTMNDLSTSLELKITPKSCNNEQFYSNQITVYCKDCLPKPTMDTPNKIVLLPTDKNVTDFNTVITGLIPNQTYNYRFTNINSTWPTVVVPFTGQFTSTDDNYTLNTRVFFCPTTGLCPSSSTSGLMTPYSMYSTSSKLRRELAENLITTNIKLNLVNVSCDSSTTYSSEPITLQCIYCIPDVQYPNVEFSSSSLTLTTGCCTGTYPLLVNMNNLYPGDKYNYSFTSSTSNITFYPRSGTISFGVGSNQSLNAILNNYLSKNERAIIQISLTHNDTGFSDTDFMTISCSPSC